MKEPEAAVLFVGEYPALSASLARVLRSLGCECGYAKTCQEARAAMEKRKFRVVLSRAKLADGNGRELLAATEAASGWLFLSFPVEDGCWWIPVMANGRLCMEGLALHSREFSQALLNTVKAVLPAAAKLGPVAPLMELPRDMAYVGSY